MVKRLDLSQALLGPRPSLSLCLCLMDPWELWKYMGPGSVFIAGWDHK